MRAVDTNVLIYAVMATSRHHAAARALLRELSENARPWAIPWPCAYEYLRVVTHPRVYHPPAPLRLALADLRAIIASPSLLLLSETPRHADVMASVLEASGVDRKSTRLNSSHIQKSRMPSSA